MKTKINSTKNKAIYLDNAASTKLSRSVLLAMKPFLEGKFGNPSSLHEQGRESKIAIESSREIVAKNIGCSNKEVVFTGSGTESINLAILGLAKAYQTKHQSAGHMIVSKIEHEAVLECVKALTSWGWKIDYLSVDKNGVVDLLELKKKVRANTALVSVMYANNEIGTIEPITEIGKIITGINKVRNQKNLQPIYFHTDACQAGGVLDLDVTKLKVDLLTLNGSKINGPKGVGILYIRTGVTVEPIIYGGGQEKGLRSGTENTPAIVGFAAALDISQKNKTKHTANLLKLQSQLEADLIKLFTTKRLTINGPRNLINNNKSKSKKDLTSSLLKLPGTTNFSLKGIEAEALMYYLNSKGFFVATGSACTTSSDEPSHVLLSIGLDSKLAKSSIRISLNEDITSSDLKYFIKALKESVDLISKTTQNL